MRINLEMIRQAGFQVDVTQDEVQIWSKTSWDHDTRKKYDAFCKTIGLTMREQDELIDEVYRIQVWSAIRKAS